MRRAPEICVTFPTVLAYETASLKHGSKYFTTSANVWNIQVM